MNRIISLFYQFDWRLERMFNCKMRAINSLIAEIEIVADGQLQGKIPAWIFRTCSGRFWQTRFPMEMQSQSKACPVKSICSLNE